MQLDSRRFAAGNSSALNSWWLWLWATVLKQRWGRVTGLWKSLHWLTGGSEGKFMRLRQSVGRILWEPWASVQDLMDFAMLLSETSRLTVPARVRTNHFLFFKALTKMGMQPLFITFLIKKKKIMKRSSLITPSNFKVVRRQKMYERWSVISINTCKAAP